MTGPLLVGYTATPSGPVVVEAASRLARALGERIALTMLLPDVVRGAVVPPQAGYESVVQERAVSWLRDASASVPTDVAHSTHLKYTDSFSEGLLEVAHEIGARLIVVGATSDGVVGRTGLGSTANDLAHSADLPVLVVPAAAASHPSGGAAGDGGLPRITVAVGTRPGAGALVREALALAEAGDVPLRLVSLVSLDLPGRVEHELADLTARAHVEKVLAEAADTAPEARIEQTVVLTGSSFTEAVAGLDWKPGEIVLIGSSRLARPSRIFLGSTASKLLRELPVPVLVVPAAAANDSSTQNGAPQ
jgi:nucleotide-binding universal stress UspA family protein